MIRYLKQFEVTKAISKQATALLAAHRSDPIGSEYPLESDGKIYIARLEEHFHPPGGSMRPWGKHPGISVLVEDSEPAAPPEPPIVPTPSIEVVEAKPRFILGSRSLAILKLADPRLVATMKRAIEITEVDFTVYCSLRTRQQQEALVRAGKSKTLNSNHLAGPNGLARAVDIAPWIGGKISWEKSDFDELARFVKRAAVEVNAPIRWGGDFPGFYDGPHWEIIPGR